MFSVCSSYLHCKWATMEELEKDPRISQKIKRFRNKQAQMKHIFTEVSSGTDSLVLTFFLLRICDASLCQGCTSGQGLFQCQISKQRALMGGRENTKVPKIRNVAGCHTDSFGDDQICLATYLREYLCSSFICWSHSIWKTFDRIYYSASRLVTCGFPHASLAGVNQGTMKLKLLSNSGCKSWGFFIPLSEKDLGASVNCFW